MSSEGLIWFGLWVLLAGVAGVVSDALSRRRIGPWRSRSAWGDRFMLFLRRVIPRLPSDEFYQTLGRCLSIACIAAAFGLFIAGVMLSA